MFMLTRILSSLECGICIAAPSDRPRRIALVVCSLHSPLLWIEMAQHCTNRCHTPSANVVVHRYVRGAGASMARLWIGPARFLFIPLIVEGRPGYDPPPADYQEFVRRRVYFDPDPQTFEDRSLTSYINSVSYGRASLDATVSTPITLNNL